MKAKKNPKTFIGKYNNRFAIYRYDFGIKILFIGTKKECLKKLKKVGL